MNNVHALAILGVLALAPLQMAVADGPSAPESSLRQSAPGKRISTLFFFVHPMRRSFR